MIHHSLKQEALNSFKKKMLKILIGAANRILIYLIGRTISMLIFKINRKQLQIKHPWIPYWMRNNGRRILDIDQLVLHFLLKSGPNMLEISSKGRYCRNYNTNCRWQDIPGYRTLTKALLCELKTQESITDAMRSALKSLL